MDKTPAKSILWKVFHTLSLMGAIVCFVALVLTGFSPLWSHSRMAGYALMIHAVCSPVFVLCVTVLVLSRSQRHAFTSGDWQDRRCLRLTTKACYWLLLVLMLPLTLSIVLSMFPWLGTHGLEIMFHLHWYSAVMFSVTVGLYIVTSVLDGRENRTPSG